MTTTAVIHDILIHPEPNKGRSQKAQQNSTRNSPRGIVNSQPYDEGDSARENKSYDDNVEKTAEARFTLLLWSG